MIKFLRWLALLLPLVLAGCGKGDSASFLIDEATSQSLSLIRNKTFMWDDRWEQALVVSRFPDCQRRYPMKEAGTERFKVEVYRAAEGGWILHQGSRWYVAETGQCLMQQFKEPPPEPGTLVGTFSDKAGQLRFVPEEVPNDPGKADTAEKPTPK